jgi:hypothetical protein
VLRQTARPPVYRQIREVCTLEYVNISEQRIQEFRKLWKEAFDEELSLDQARHEASLLLELYAALAESLPSEQLPLPSMKEQPHDP